MHSSKKFLALFFASLFLNGTTICSVLPGLVGKLPKKISWAIESLNGVTRREKKGDESATYHVPPISRLILHGPPGNGKSTIARLMAELTNRELIELPGPSVVDKYVGNGAENVRLTFSKARDMVAMLERGAIIFMDEIDAIAANNTEKFRAEHMGSC